MLVRLFIAILFGTSTLSLPINDEEQGYRLVCKKDKKGCYVTGNQEIAEDELFEGDIIRFAGDDEDRNALISKHRKWPNNTVPYIFHAGFDPKAQSLVEEAMRFIESKTCIKFQEFDPDLGHMVILFITNGDGCRATIGFDPIGRMHLLNLNERSCVNKLEMGKMHHEMLHVLGLKHEQSRPDRDDYVTIVEENIIPGKEYNFKKASEKEYTTYGVPYDYLSVMHYPSVSYSSNGSPTIVPKNNVDHKLLGQRKEATVSDIKKINIMYDCPQKDD